jgi:hypothetical protein
MSVILIDGMSDGTPEMMKYVPLALDNFTSPAYNSII